jgi:predicted O-methyltransferase YrrM
MSEESTAVEARHFRYIAERTTAEDPFLAELKAAARAAELPSIWIASEQIAFLQILLRAANARRVVEVGTLAGVSAIGMARALPPGGRVDTIELDAKHAAFAQKWIGRSDVADRITLHQGAGAEVLARLPAGEYDASFIDADKANYPVYLRESLRLVRPGGLILVDNALAFGRLFADDPDESVRAVRSFNDLMPATAGLQSVIVPIGDGMWVGVRT